MTAPADDYVADFVAGISRLKLVSAGKIMMAFDQHVKEFGAVPDHAPVADADDDLDTLVSLSTTTDAPILIQSDNKTIGVVTKDTLLRGLQGGESA